MEKTEEIKQMKNLIRTYLLKELNQCKGDETVFFGTGLASTSAPSLGFGIDILSTILASLKVKRILDGKEVLHLLSTTGYNISEDTKENIIKKQEDMIEKIINNLGIKNEYRFIKSSDFINKPEFKIIKLEVERKLARFRGITNFDEYGEYTILQTAICKYLYEYENVRVKTGWCTKEKDRPLDISEEYIKGLIEEGHLNEFYFDEIYRYVYPEDNYSYIYTQPAIGLNGRCSPPYTVTENDIRPLIDEDIKVYVNEYIKKINSYTGQKKKDLKKKLKNAIENWRKTIINPYEELFGEVTISSELTDEIDIVLEKISIIQAKILGEIIKYKKPQQNEGGR